VWSDAVVNAEALGYALHAVRRAVGDDGIRQEVIRTIPRSGLRFVAPLDVTYQADSPRSKSTPGPQTGSGAIQAPAVPFIGREFELSELQRALEKVLDGSRRLILVSGEAGIGKTRLAEEFARRAADQGVRVVLARSSEVECAPAFWPWIQVVRSLIRDVALRPNLFSLGASVVEIARIVPELCDCLPTFAASTTHDPRTARLLLFDGITAFLQRVARTQPILLLLEDLHCADQPSLLLLEFLLRETANVPLFVLSTHRETEMRLDARRQDLLSRAQRREGVQVIHLNGFVPTEVQDFVTATCKVVPNTHLIDDLCDKTAGNPLFLNQLVQLLAAENRLSELTSATKIRVTLPRRVQDLIAGQICSLPSACRQILEIASVIGRDFFVEILKSIAQLDHDQIFDALEIAEQANFIRPQQDSHGRYRFTHELFREAIYRGLSASRRIRIHQRVGRSLENFPTDHQCPDYAALAHHFFQCATAGEAERAILYSVKAGEWACEQVAFEEAPAHFLRAVEILDATSPGDASRRCQLLLKLGDVQIKAGEREKARRTLLDAAKIATRAGEPKNLALVALRFAPDFLAIETGVFDSDLVELLEEALATLEKRDSAVRARLLVRLAIALHWSNNSERRRAELCNEALAMAERVGDSAALAYVERGKQLALYSTAQPEHYLEPRHKNILARDDAPIALVLYLLRMTSLLILGRIEEFDLEAKSFRRMAEKLGQPQALWYSDLLYGTRSQMSGDYELAKRCATRFLAQGSRISDRNAVHSFVLQSMMASIDIGGLERYEPIVSEIAKSSPRILGWRAGLALIFAELGRNDDARIQLDALRANRILDIPERNEWFAAMGGLALTSKLIEDREFLERLYRKLLPHAEHFAVVGYCSFFWGSVHHLLGVIAGEIGGWQAMRTHFEKAMNANRRVGAWACLARTQYDFGCAIVNSRKNAREAAAILWECQESAGKLKMARLEMKAGALIKEIEDN